MSFLEDVYAADNENSAIDLVIEHFEKLFWAAQFEECSKIMNNADVGRMQLSVALSFLSMTLAVKKKLGVSRTDFYARVVKKIEDDPQKRDNLVALMQGLA